MKLDCMSLNLSCVCVFMCMCLWFNGACVVTRSEDNFQKSVFYFYHVSFGEQIQLPDLAEATLATESSTTLKHFMLKIMYLLE